MSCLTGLFDALTVARRIASERIPFEPEIVASHETSHAASGRRRDTHRSLMFRSSGSSAPKRLLKGGAEAIDEVSAAVGYEDPSFFRRVFKRVVGLRPVDYRRKSGTGPVAE